MIGERSVHAREFDAGHVTRYALLCADRTGIGVTARGLSVRRFRYVTGEAFWIVVRRVFLELLVRVVTRHTAKPRIVRIVSATTEHAIRLEANVVDASLPRLQHRLLKTCMTRSAKRLREIVRTQVARIEDLQPIKLLFLHGDEMLLAWPMTRFTPDTRTQLV